jgi:tetratricopeptide (TPR) repeat protein
MLRVLLLLCLLQAPLAQTTPAVDAEAHFDRGKALIDYNIADNYDATQAGLEEGIAELRRAIALGCGDKPSAYKALVHAYLALARIYVGGGDPEGRNRDLAESRDVCRTLLDIAPDDVEALSVCASAFRGAPDEQLRLYRKVVVLAPENAEGRFMLGMLLVDKGDLAAGAQEVRQAINLEDQMIPMSNYGDRLIEKLQAHGCKGAVVEPPPSEFLVLGYEDAGRYEEARRDYKKRINKMLDGLECLREHAGRHSGK